MVRWPSSASHGELRILVAALHQHAAKILPRLDKEGLFKRLVVVQWVVLVCAHHHATSVAPDLNVNVRVLGRQWGINGERVWRRRHIHALAHLAKALGHKNCGAGVAHFLAIASTGDLLHLARQIHRLLFLRFALVHRVDSALQLARHAKHLAHVAKLALGRRIRRHHGRQVAERSKAAGSAGATTGAASATKTSKGTHGVGETTKATRTARSVGTASCLGTLKSAKRAKRGTKTASSTGTTWETTSAALHALDLLLHCPRLLEHPHGAGVGGHVCHARGACIGRRRNHALNCCLPGLSIASRVSREIERAVGTGLPLGADLERHGRDGHLGSGAWGQRIGRGRVALSRVGDGAGVVEDEATLLLATRQPRVDEGV
eukprot:m.132816 g.132816  ORF g.132816 m.132816 type:complete len:376 (+) comp9840_c0_seq1:868-1995(+)